ncbi:hypothetical protein ACFWNL_18485 [Kitasatospora sp. NPDC058397]|uniref:hypothetical protein n=1 Tax=unclassified Kitasatospora TaxID=2633591 RepID=UPI0036612353
MTQTHATAYAVTAANREIPAGHLMTRVEAGRRAGRLLDVSPGTAGRRITAAVAAGELVELRAAGDCRLTIPGAPADAIVWAAPGTVEGTVEVVMGDVEDTVEVVLSDIPRSTPRRPLTRRPLVISAADCKRLAQELCRLWAEARTAAETGPAAIEGALAAAELPSADTGRGWMLSTSGATGAPMVIHVDGARITPRRGNTDDAARWGEALAAIETALAAGGFRARRSGHAVLIEGRRIVAAGPVVEAEQPQEPAAEPVVEEPAELVRISGACFITTEQVAAMKEQAATDRAAYEAESERRRAAQAYHYGPEREAAQRAAVGQVRELLGAAGVPDLNATPTANTGFRARKADRPGVWVMIGQTRGIGNSRPDPRRLPFDAREWDANFETWAGVLRRAGWETTEPTERAFYATPPAEAEQRVEDVVEAEVVEDDQEQPATAPAAGAAVVLFVDEPLPPAAAEAARAILAADRKSGVEEFDPRELVGSVFADGLPIETTAPDAVAALRRAGEESAEPGAVEDAAAALLAATRTAGLGTWRRVARWLTGREIERRTGAASGTAGGDLVEDVPELLALVDAAARLLARWLTGHYLPDLKAADRAARQIAEALHAATGAGRQTVWLQIARYAVEREAAALPAPTPATEPAPLRPSVRPAAWLQTIRNGFEPDTAARPVAELPAGTGEQPVTEPGRLALPAPAGARLDAAADLLERMLKERQASDGLGPLPESVRVLDYDLGSWEWGFECSLHGGEWERQPGDWATRAEAEGFARLHAEDHAAEVAAVRIAEEEFEQAAALGFSAEQAQVLNQARLGRICEDARGFYYDTDGATPSGVVQGRRVMDLWARGLVKVHDMGPGRHHLTATAAGAAVLDLWTRARRMGIVTPSEADTMGSTGKERAAYPRIKPAPSPAAATEEPAAEPARTTT